jgi:hypothetical protein
VKTENHRFQWETLCFHPKKARDVLDSIRITFHELIDFNRTRVVPIQQLPHGKTQARVWNGP